MTASLDHSDVPAYAQLLSLAGRGFLVAGAGNGIGRQTAHALAAVGARVACVDLIEERAKAVADEVGGLGLTADMGNRQQVQAAIDASCQWFGRMHGIVDIIGMARFKDLTDMTEEDWDWTHQINFRPAALLTQLGGERIARDGGGSLTFISSVSGLTGAPGAAAYGAMKAAMTALMRSGSIEYGSRQVRMNAVAPGLVWTERMATSFGEEKRRTLSRIVPLGRLAEASDVAAAVLFLASDLGAYVSGHTLVLDGAAAQKSPFPAPNTLT